MRASPNRELKSLWQRTILRGVTARYARKEKAAARKAARELDRGVGIVTNNWLIVTDWLRETGIRFDERPLLTGGTDTRFYKQATALAIRSGWSPQAVVYETVPENRLTFRYQAARARDQATNGFHRKYDHASAGRIARTSAIASGKLLGGLLCFFCLPIAGGRAVVQSARMIGGGWGLFRALLGKQSLQYQNTDGW